MSEKMTCPACTSHTSSVLEAFRNREPCPYCGLGADAALQINDIKKSRANESVQRMAQEAIERADRAEAEARRLRRILDAVRRALDEDEEPE